MPSAPLPYIWLLGQPGLLPPPPRATPVPPRPPPAPHPDTGPGAQAATRYKWHFFSPPFPADGEAAAGLFVRPKANRAGKVRPPAARMPSSEGLRWVRGGGTEGVKRVINYPRMGNVAERNRKKTLTAGFFAFLASLFFPQVTLKGCRQADSSAAPFLVFFSLLFFFLLFVFYTLALEPDTISVQGLYGASSGWEIK